MLQARFFCKSGNYFLSIGIIAALLSMSCIKEYVPPVKRDIKQDTLSIDTPATDTIKLVCNDWQCRAEERIDLYRKADLSIKVLNPTGEPLKGIPVTVKLKRHKFYFGAVVVEDLFIGDKADLFKPIFLKYFNAAGFPNGLKPKQWGQTLESNAEEAILWFLENDIKMRGHTLVWESESHYKPEQQVAIFQDDTKSPQEKFEAFKSYTESFMDHAFSKWDVFCWDAINEPLGNHEVNDWVPENTFELWFNLADSYRKKHGREDVKLFLNENRVISRMAHSEPWVVSRQADFISIIEDLVEVNTPIDGIGLQSRIKNGYLPPDTLFERLNAFNKFNLPLHATEHEVRDGTYKYTDQEKKKIVEELLTIYFSHPLVEGIWAWTFVDNNGERPYALFGIDGNPYPAGEKWIELLTGKFTTHETLQTDSLGKVALRGFMGDYEISTEINGSIIVQDMVLEKDGLEVVLQP